MFAGSLARTLSIIFTAVVMVAARTDSYSLLHTGVATVPEGSPRLIENFDYHGPPVVGMCVVLHDGENEADGTIIEIGDRLVYDVKWDSWRTYEPPVKSR